MALFTCSYAAFRAEMGQPVRITLGKPRQPEPTGRATWLYLAEAAPRGWYFNAPPEKFAARYLSQLDRHADDILAKVGWLADEYGPLVLLCYERRIRGEQDCHRARFSAWWRARTGEVIPELDARQVRK